MPSKSSNKNLRISFGDSSISGDDLAPLQFDHIPTEHVSQQVCGNYNDSDISNKSEHFPEVNSSFGTIASRETNLSSTSYDFEAHQSDRTSLSSSSKVLMEGFCLDKGDFSSSSSSTLAIVEHLSNHLDPKKSLDGDTVSSNLDEIDSSNKYSTSITIKDISLFPFE